MYVRVLIGIYAGDIRDFDPVCARRMLEAGEAEDPYAEPAARRPEASLVTVPARSAHSSRRAAKA